MQDVDEEVFRKRRRVAGLIVGAVLVAGISLILVQLPSRETEVQIAETEPELSGADNEDQVSELAPGEAAVSDSSDQTGIVDSGALEEPISGDASDSDMLAQYYDHKPIDKYIDFRTTYAEQVVRTFDVACPQPGKSIRLMDVLRWTAQEGSHYGSARLYITADSRGDEVRIYHQVRLEDGRSNEPHVVMVVDNWGELRLIGIRPEALMYRCYL